MSKSIVGKLAKGKVQSIVTEFVADKTAEAIDKGNDRLEDYALKNQGSFVGDLAGNIAEGSQVTQKGLEYFANPAKLDDDLNPILSQAQQKLNESAEQNFQEGNTLIGTYQEGASEFIEGFKDGVKIATKPLETTVDVVKTVGDTGGKIADKVVETIVDAVKTVGDTGGKIADKVVETTVDVVKTVGDTGGKIADKVVETTVDVIKTVGDTADKVVGAVKWVATDPNQTVSESYLAAVNTNNYLADPNENGQNGIFSSSQTLALLNQHGYSDDKNDKLPAGFSVLDENLGTKSGYDVRVYINKETREITVSHRGSENSSLQRFLQDWVNADGGIAIGSGPQAQIKDALAYNEKLQKLITEKYSDFTVIQTGHSLGGFIAQVIGAKNGQQTTTFDSPGAKEYIDKLGIKDYEKNITTIQGPNNLINQAGSQPGSTLQIQPSDVELGSTKMTILDILAISGVHSARAITISKHYLSHLVTKGKSKADELLIQEIMENGKISRSELVKLISTLDSGQSLANNAANWHPLDNYWKYFKDPTCVPMKVIGEWKSNRTLDNVLYGDINTGAITRIGVNPPKPYDKNLTLTQDKSMVAHAQKIAKRAQMLTKTIGLK